MKRKALRAFTLVELLTVITIIAILLSLSLVGVSHVKQKAGIAHCASNLRQLNFGWMLYSDDYEGRLIPNAPVKNLTAKGGSLDMWIEGTLRYGWYNFPGNTNIQDLRNSKLTRYINTLEVYKCPKDRTMNPFFAQDEEGVIISEAKYPWFRSVGINQWMGGLNQKMYNTIYYTMSQIDEPSKRYTFINQRADTYENGYFVTGTVGIFDPLRYKWHEYPSRYHGSTTPVAFSDGHIELHRWKTKWPAMGDLFETGGRIESPHNPDIEWINTHATTPRKGL